MGLIILIVILTSLGWTAFAVVRSLKRRNAGRGWWAALGVCMLTGLTCGIWFGGFFEYSASPRLRVVGFPIAAAVFALEKYADGQEHWTDYVTPVPLLVVATDSILFLLVSPYPVWLVHTLWWRHFTSRKAAAFLF